MITVFSYDNLGHINHGWLDARHHFNFGRYFNSARKNFGNLLVINDDKIAPRSGFDLHSHRNMEIITYVRKGEISHKDSAGNSGKTSAGNVQVMSAGSGIEHSEYNLSDIETNLYQIWILPNKQNVQPRWEAKEFPQKPLENGDNLPILVSGRNEDRDKSALFIHSDSAIYGGLIKKDNTIKVNIKHQAYILASSGDLKINNIKIKKGDGAEITNEKTIEINAISDAEALIIDVEA